MNIAQNLKLLMEKRGLSNSRLAREIHVHTSTVSNWLDGKEVKAENLTALCEYVGCSLDYLAGSTTATKKAPAETGERAIDDDDIKAAFFGGVADDLSTEEIDELWEDARRFARYIAEQKKKEK